MVDAVALVAVRLKALHGIGLLRSSTGATVEPQLVPNETAADIPRVVKSPDQFIAARDVELRAHPGGLSHECDGPIAAARDEIERLSRQLPGRCARRDVHDR